MEAIQQLNDFKPIELNGDEIYGQINDFIQSQQFQDAVNVVEDYEEKQSSNVSFLMLASQAYKGMQNFEKESSCLKKLIEMDQKPRYSILLAESLSHQGDFPQALKTLNKVLDEADGKDPILFEVHKNMGNIYLKCGDIEAAEESYNKANSINSQDENLIVNYGVLAILRGEYSEDKNRFAEVLETNTQSDLAWVGMALVHRAHGDLDLSRACLLRGLDENPFNKLAISNYYQWCHQDNVDATSEIMDGYLATFPNDREMKQLSNSMSH